MNRSLTRCCFMPVLTLLSPSPLGCSPLFLFLHVTCFLCVSTGCAPRPPGHLTLAAPLQLTLYSPLDSTPQGGGGVDSTPQGGGACARQMGTDGNRCHSPPCCPLTCTPHPSSPAASHPPSPDAPHPPHLLPPTSPHLLHRTPPHLLPAPPLTCCCPLEGLVCQQLPCLGQAQQYGALTVRDGGGTLRGEGGAGEVEGRRRARGG